jgi:TatD DNase family protein
MPTFNKDRTSVIDRAQNAGVSTIITVGTDLKSSQKAIKLAENHSEVIATVGIHPHHATAVRKEDITNLARIASHPRVVGIGEMGLDFFRNYSLREVQLQVLKWQLELAVELDMPVIIHCRQADKELLPLLRDWASHYKRLKRQLRGVIHCFCGDIDTARQYLAMGFFISLGAYIGYPTATNMHNVIRNIPRDRLLVETDSPYLPPQSQRGQRNEPAYLPLTVEILAKIRQVSPEIIARETTKNALKLFRLHHG